MNFGDIYLVPIWVLVHAPRVGRVEGGGGREGRRGSFSVCFGPWNRRESMIGTPPITELDPQHGIPFYWWSKNQIPPVVVVCFDVSSISVQYRPCDMHSVTWSR